MMIQLSMLGTAQIKIGRTVFTPNAARRFALLLYLLNERAAIVSRTKLLKLFYHDQRPRQANHSLRELLYELRRLGVPLTKTSDGVSMSANSVASDLAVILGAAVLSEAQLDAIDSGFLPGYAPTLSDSFGDWLGEFRAQTGANLSGRLVAELRRVHANEDWPATERIARVCLRVDPLNEAATLALAERLALAGERTDAMRLLDQYITGIGGPSSQLSLPAFVLRRRIAERLPRRYGVESILPFVGRDVEMTALTDRLERVGAGESGCAVLVGEPGIGKTRLATEFVARSALKGVRYVTAAAQPHDTHRPMGAFVDVVPQLLDLPGALGCSPASMAALKRLTFHDSSAPETIVEFPGQAEEVAFSIARAISDLVDAITAEAPLILWLEDVHWLDEMSLQMAASLVSNRISRRLLIVMTTRERRPLPGRCGEHATTIIVRPLTTEAARVLAADALAMHFGGDESNLHWLVATAAGNPLFLTSLVNHVVRTGERYAVPATISELLDERIAALSSSAMNVLEACVLLGKQATAERVVASMELPHFQLVTMLKELEDQRIIVKNRELIQVSHWLIADAVRRRSSPIATELSHRRIAELLEAEARDTQSPALLWDCSEHWLASGNATKAIQTIRECSKYAVEIGRSREGAELLQRAAQLASGELHVELIEESIRLACSASESDIILAGVKMLRAAGIPPRHDDIEFAELVSIGFRTNDTEEACARFTSCLESPDSTPAHKLQISTPALVFCMHHNKPQLAHDVFRVVNSLISTRDAQHSIHALQFYLIYYSYFGDPAKARTIAHQMLARSDWPIPQQADACRKAGMSLWVGDHATEALEALDRGFELASKSGLSRLAFVIAMMAASIHSDIGTRDESRRWLATAERIADDNPALRDNFEYLITKTDIASATCDVAELQLLIDAAQRLGIPYANHRIRRWATALRALIAHLSGAEMDSKAVIAELTENHRDGELGDIADLEMAIALRISRTAERRATTMLRLRQYLERRRPAPLLAMLQQTISELEHTGRRR
jgi:DNA-binding SARP family transcriptional activator